MSVAVAGKKGYQFNALVISGGFRDELGLKGLLVDTMDLGHLLVKVPVVLSRFAEC
jgi:hypothetical protein